MLFSKPAIIKRFNSSFWHFSFQVFLVIFLVFLFFSWRTSLGSQHLASVFSSCSDAEFISSKNAVLFDTCFGATLVNLSFLLLPVQRNSSLFRFEKGSKSLVHIIHYHLGLWSFCRFSYVCLLILLHFLWTQTLQLLHWMQLWLSATGRLQILQ